jgi:NAD(P)-dependent dehydrogenase (short-subunit alcohol dehydrogenase family)
MGACLITGGARGIGRATALLAAEASWDVAVGCRERRDAAEAVAREVEGRGRRAAVVAGNVGDPAAVPGLFEAAERALGPLSGLVCAAGIGHSARVEAFDAADLTRLMAVNVVGLMLCCREAARRMSTARGGRGGAIVNVSSMAATIGGRPGASAYAASKAAVDVFTAGFAKEVAVEGVRVNVVRPGVILTDMTAGLRDDAEAWGKVAASIPMQRVGAPEEVARAIVWLLSPEASFVTGAHLNVGGGGFVIGTPMR